MFIGAKHLRIILFSSAFLTAGMVGFLPPSAPAQTGLGTLTGVVSDSTGAVVAGVSVTLKDPATGAAFEGVTNASGTYTIPSVKPGPGYTVTFHKDGFQDQVITGLYLNISATRTQDATMKVGNTAQTVEVSAASETVTLDTADATVGNNFQVQFLNNLPVANRDSPSALFYQQPGVTLDGAVTGARTDQSNVTIDGLEVNDDATGGFGNIVGTAPVDSVEEFRGTSANQLASAGQGGGGQYDLVTKSGTNHFHGSLVEYHRDTDLTANTWFNNNNGTPRSPLIRNQFGGNLGGPILHERAFFFFDWNSRRDTLANQIIRVVPLGDNNNGYRGGEIAYPTSQGGTTTLTAAQVAAMDPNRVGWNQAELKLFQQRIPVANDTTGDCTGCDLVNWAGYRFNSPYPFTENDFVQRADWNLNPKMKLSGVGAFVIQDSTQASIQWPGDPATYPFKDRSYRWEGTHTWQLSDRMLNVAEVGETFEDYNFDVAYNPQGAYQYGFAGVAGPYGSGSNSQARTYPILQFRDDFSWQKGRHNLGFGGTFKVDTPDSYAAENYYFPTVGVAGNTNLETLSTPAGVANPLRPADLANSAADRTRWDQAFSTALGVINSVNANFNYDNKGNVQQQGSGLDLKYRYYETEIYFADTWKVTPSIAISYGLRYQNYTVPYEMRGLQAITNLNNAGQTEPFSWDTYWSAREAQSANGTSTNDSLPLLQFIYGGKVNHQPGYFAPSNKNFAPRAAIAWNPAWDRKTVIRAGGGVVYDHSLINALQFQQLQTSYLFEASNTLYNGVSADPVTSLQTMPRFAGIDSPPQGPAIPVINTPNIPFIDTDGSVTGNPGEPDGLIDSQFNLMMDTKLKVPYNIQLDFGVQHEFPQGYILKMDYVGRLGRRLLATADSSQLLDFPDNTGGSNQTMGQAFGGLTTQLRANGDDATSVQPEPWFEDMIGPGLTQEIASVLDPLPYYGDFADVIQAISRLLPPNVGMASQFASNSVWTNKGSSNYHGLLVTLHKNVGYGLQFDLNYTYSHSIDNVSNVANFIASSSGYGFICDVQRPRECRGNSNFDVTHYLNGNFIYELPFGRGMQFLDSSSWLNELIGGWSVSGLPEWHTGNAYNATSNAYVTSYANNAPATLVGSRSLLKVKLHGGGGHPLLAFADSNTSAAAFHGPVGFDIGSRNNLRGPGFFNLDLGLGKTFPILESGLNLKFRADAFNALNHPNFGLPAADITQSSTPFGNVSSQLNTNGIDSRVLQLALRLEF